MEYLKQLLRDELGIPVVLVFVAAGLVAHLVLNALLRRSPLSAWGLLAPLALGIVIEARDIWVHYRHVGLFAPGNDHVMVILARHGADVLKMVAIPLVAVVLGRLRDA